MGALICTAFSITLAHPFSTAVLLSCFAALNRIDTSKASAIDAITGCGPLRQLLIVKHAAVASVL